MKGLATAVIAAMVGVGVAVAMFAYLSSISVFDHYISTNEAERDLIVALHISEAVRLFSETAMEYSLNAAVPNALKGGGHPGSGDFEGAPISYGIRYWGWCEKEEEELVCDEVCTYMTINTEDSGFERLLSAGTEASISDLLESYAQEFMRREIHETSISPVSQDVEFSLSNEVVSFDARVDTAVHTITKDGTHDQSRGMVRATEEYSHSQMVPGIGQILSQGKTALRALPIDDAVEYADDAEDEEDKSKRAVWNAAFADYLRANYEPANNYVIDFEVIQFENRTECVEVTFSVNITEKTGSYQVYQEDRLEEGLLELIFLIEKRVDRG